MKSRLWQIILYAILLILTIGFGLLKSVWAGFAYFSIATVFALCILFIVNRILYILDLKAYYEENLGLYLAELLNNRLITRQQYEEKDPTIIKGYYKQFKRSKNLQILIITLIILVLISVIFVLVDL